MVSVLNKEKCVKRPQVCTTFLLLILPSLLLSHSLLFSILYHSTAFLYLVPSCSLFYVILRHSTRAQWSRVGPSVTRGSNPHMRVTMDVQLD
ncbi:hypothetical protein B0J14DRAFT_597149 [Halenospora varia]|nr:hypothetical protein B0J14DRAFT_597149 [Halenospora varia]